MNRLDTASISAVISSGFETDPITDDFVLD